MKDSRLIARREYELDGLKDSHLIQIDVFERDIDENAALYTYKVRISIAESRGVRPSLRRVYHNNYRINFTSNLGPTFATQWRMIINAAIRAHILDAQVKFNINQDQAMERFYPGIDVGLCFVNGFLSYWVISRWDRQKKDDLGISVNSMESTVGTAEVK